MTSQSPTDEQATPEYRKAWLALSHLILEEGASWSGREKNCAYLNLGDGHFANVSPASGADYQDDGRAVAAVDWDDDGRLDLLVRNRTGPRLRLLRNRLPAAGHFLVVELQATAPGCNREAVGSVVEVQAGGRRLRRTLHAGSGYLCQDTRRLHFGLGEATRVEGIQVTWPDGSHQEWGELPADSRWRLVQGEAEPRPLPARTHAELAGIEAPVSPDTESRYRVVLVDKLPMAEWHLPRWGGEARKVAELAGGPVLVNLWATWCPSCLRELAGFQARADDLRAAGVRVVALSTDAPEDREEARRRIAAFGLEADSGAVDQAWMEALEVVFHEVLGPRAASVLPTSLLLDRAGQLVVLYQGPVEVEELLADVATLRRMNPADRITWPLSGGRRTVHRRRDLRGLADALAGLGAGEVARWYRRLAFTDARRPVFAPRGR